MIKGQISFFIAVLIGTLSMIVVNHSTQLANAIAATSMEIIVNNKTPISFKLGSEHMSYGAWKEEKRPLQTMAPNSNSTWQAEITDGVPGFNGYATYLMNGDSSKWVKISFSHYLSGKGNSCRVDKASAVPYFASVANCAPNFNTNNSPAKIIIEKTNVNDHSKPSLKVSVKCMMASIVIPADVNASGFPANTHIGFSITPTNNTNKDLKASYPSNLFLNIPKDIVTDSSGKFTTHFNVDITAGNYNLYTLHVFVNESSNNQTSAPMKCG
jgi:hypothetical protein